MSALEITTKKKKKGEDRSFEMKTRENGRSYFQRVQVIQGCVAEGKFHMMKIMLPTIHIFYLWVVFSFS